MDSTVSIEFNDEIYGERTRRYIKVCVDDDLIIIEQVDGGQITFSKYYWDKFKNLIEATDRVIDLNRR